MSRRKRVERSLRRLITANTLEELFRGTAVERSLTFVVLDELAAPSDELRAVAERVARREGVTYEYLLDRVMVFVASINEIRSRDLFRQLGVPRSATMEDIRRRWRTVAKELHPDTGGGDPEAFLKARDAYETLADPDRRGRYEGYWSQQVAPVEQAAMLAGDRSCSAKTGVDPEIKSSVGKWSRALSWLSSVRRSGQAVLWEQRRRGAMLVVELRRGLLRWLQWLGEWAGKLITGGARRLLVWSVAGMRLGRVVLDRVGSLAGTAERMARLLAAYGLKFSRRDRRHSWSLPWVSRLRRAVADPAWQRTAVSGAAVITIAFVIALFYSRQQSGPNLDEVFPPGSASSDELLTVPAFSPAGGLTLTFNFPEESRDLSRSEGLATHVTGSSVEVTEQANSDERQQSGIEPVTLAAVMRGQGRSTGAGERSVGVSNRILAASSDSLVRARDAKAVSPGSRVQAQDQRPLDSKPQPAGVGSKTRVAAEVAGLPHRTQVASREGRTASGHQVRAKRVVARRGLPPTVSTTTKAAALLKSGPRGEARVRKGHRGGATEAALASRRSSIGKRARGVVVPARERTDALDALSKSATMIVSRTEAIDFVERFRRIYEQRDASALSRLFAENASENDVVGRQQIAAAYRGTFGEMGRVRYFLGEPEVHPLGAWADVRAPFTIAYRERTGRYGELSGRARWWLVRDGRDLKVLRLEYEIDVKSR